jgi:Putative zinc-finger
MTDRGECQAIRELLPELAAGVASGDQRARALAHLTGCPDCRRELEEAATLVDDLMLVLAPEHEPSAGFESRVLAALPVTRPRRSRRRPTRRLVLQAAAAMLATVLVAVLAVGLTWRHTAEDRQLAAHYRSTLAVADGRYLTAAGLVAATGQKAGHVFAYQGSPSWLFVELTAAPASGSYAIRLVTTDGRTVDAGVCRVTAGSGSYGRTIDLAVSAIRRVELVQPGSPTLVASLH